MIAKFAILCCVMLQGCSSSHITLAWKNDKEPETYSKIMVAGIVGPDDDSLRLQIEKDFVIELKSLGYNAISAMEEFGQHGLANMTQEETYIKLCNREIDAVITIALIDGSKEKSRISKRSYGFPDNYYYDRIWNYKNIQATSANDSNDKPVYFWESILFNLRTLEAESTIQTKPFSIIDTKKTGHEFEKSIIKKMLKEKIIRNIKKDKKAF